MYETIILEQRPDGVAKITLNRPDDHNLLNLQMVRDLKAVLKRLHLEKNIRVVCLVASGKSFCPGVRSDFGSEQTSERAVSVSAQGTIPHLIYTMPVPTIAVVNGPCAGVGLALACACDLRFCAPEATFRSAFLSVGLAGDMGLPWLLTKIVGAGKARQISFMDHKIKAAEALAMGLVSKVVEASSLEEETDAVAAEIAQGPNSALRALKSHYLAADRMGLEDFLDLEFQRHFHLAATDDFKDRWRKLAKKHSRSSASQR